MASNKIIPKFDNDRGMDFDEGIPHIKRFFLRELPQFILMREYKYANGHWGLTFADHRFHVFIGFDLGYLEFSIAKHGKDVYPLLMYPELSSVKAASEININYVLLKFKEIICESK